MRFQPAKRRTLRPRTAGTGRGRRRPTATRLAPAIMKRYFNIHKEIALGFFNGREQYDVLIEPGHGWVMFNGCDIYWVVDGQERMSETINNAIAIWLKDGSIEETAPVIPLAPGRQ